MTTSTSNLSHSPYRWSSHEINALRHDRTTYFSNLPKDLFGFITPCASYRRLPDLFNQQIKLFHSKMDGYQAYSSEKEFYSEITVLREFNIQILNSNIFKFISNRSMKGDSLNKDLHKQFIRALSQRLLLILSIYHKLENSSEKVSSIFKKSKDVYLINKMSRVTNIFETLLANETLRPIGNTEINYSIPKDMTGLIEHELKKNIFEEIFDKEIDKNFSI